MNQSKKIIPSINGLRAVSIIIVLIYHLSYSGNLPPMLQHVIQRYLIGTIGVRMFFVISGFLITYLLLTEREKSGTVNLFQFYLRRLLRIFPVFYFYILVICLLKQLKLVNVEYSSVAVAVLYLDNFRIAPSNWLVGHSWSLAVEEQFYLLWPAMFLFVTRLRNRHLLIAFLIGAVMRTFYFYSTDLSKPFLAPFLRNADFLFIGCFLGFQYFYYREQMRQFFNRFNGYWLIGGALMVSAVTHFEYSSWFNWFFIPLGGIVVVIISALTLMYFIFRSTGRIGKILNSPLFDYIGKLSYSLYVWQQLFLGSAIVLEDKIKWIALFPQNIFLTVGAALLSYYAIEKPFLKLKDRISHSGPASSTTAKKISIEPLRVATINEK